MRLAGIPTVNRSGKEMLRKNLRWEFKKKKDFKKKRKKARFRPRNKVKFKK